MLADMPAEMPHPRWRTCRRRWAEMGGDRKRVMTHRVDAPRHSLSLSTSTDTLPCG